MVLVVYFPFQFSNQSVSVVVLKKDMSNEISAEQALYGAILSPGALLRDYLSFFPLYVCAVFNGFRSLPAHAMFFLCCRETSFHTFKLFSIMNKFSTDYYKKKKKKKKSF